MPVFLPAITSVAVIARQARFQYARGPSPGLYQDRLVQGLERASVLMKHALKNGLIRSSFYQAWAKWN